MKCVMETEHKLFLHNRNQIKIEKPKPLSFGFLFEFINPNN